MNCSVHNRLMDYDLKELDAIIRIPCLYKSVDEKEIKRIINKENDSRIRDELLTFIIQNPNENLLIDTTNPYKYILISTITPYVVIDSNTFYYWIDHQRSLSSSKPFGDSQYYVGSKMGRIAHFKFIESKYQRGSEGKQRIGITYIISSEAKTIGIGFFSPEIQDVRQYINSIKRK